MRTVNFRFPLKTKQAVPSPDVHVVANVQTANRVLPEVPSIAFDSSGNTSRHASQPKLPFLGVDACSRKYHNRYCTSKRLGVELTASCQGLAYMSMGKLF